MYKSPIKGVLYLSILFILSSTPYCFASQILLERFQAIEDNDPKKILWFPHISSCPLLLLSAPDNSQPWDPKEREKLFARLMPRVQVRSPKFLKDGAIEFEIDIMGGYINPDQISHLLSSILPVSPNLGRPVKGTLPQKPFWHPNDLLQMRPLERDSAVFTREPLRELRAHILDLTVATSRLKKEIKRLTAEISIEEKIKQALKEGTVRKEVGKVDYERIESELPKDVYDFFNIRPHQKPIRHPRPETLDEGFVLLGKVPAELPDTKKLAQSLMQDLKRTIEKAKEKEQRDKESRGVKILRHYAFADSKISSLQYAHLEEEYTALLKGFQGLDPAGVAKSLQAHYYQLLLQEKKLENDLRQHQLLPFGVVLKQRYGEISLDFREQPADFSIERWREYQTAKNSPEIWRFMQANTYGIERLSLRGEVLNHSILETLKSLHWTKIPDGSIKVSKISPRMEKLERLELSFNTFDGDALPQVLALAAHDKGLKSLRLKGEISLKNLAALSKVGSLEKLEIQYEELFDDPLEFVQNFVRLFPKNSSLKELEITFVENSFEWTKDVLEKIIREALPGLKMLTIILPEDPGEAKELTDDTIENAKPKGLNIHGD